MFEKLEKDTEKVINDSKSGTRFFGSYSNEYRTETYTNEKGKKRNRRVYIGDDYIIDDEKYTETGIDISIKHPGFSHHV